MMGGVDSSLIDGDMVFAMFPCDIFSSPIINFVGPLIDNDWSMVLVMFIIDSLSAQLLLVHPEALPFEHISQVLLSGDIEAMENSAMAAPEDGSVLEERLKAARLAPTPPPTTKKAIATFFQLIFICVPLYSEVGYHLRLLLSAQYLLDGFHRRILTRPALILEQIRKTKEAKLNESQESGLQFIESKTNETGMPLAASRFCNGLSYLVGD